MDNHPEKAGETYVADLLERRGCWILYRNYHSRFDEIDIIAQNGGYLVFVEVKTRGKCCSGVPQEAMTASKRRKLILTAPQYPSEHDPGLQPRLDVTVVRTNEAEQVVLTEYFESAFDAEGCFA